MQLLSLAILALTVGMALTRPRVGGLRFDHAGAALVGAGLVLLTGLVPPDLALQTIERLIHPAITIVSLMVITLVAEEAGLLRLVTDWVARAARGNGQRLFMLIFVVGAGVGMIFTNDAAILIFTPLVYTLVERIGGDEWPLDHKLPFYFAVLYVGNLVGAFVISNPINIIVASVFQIGFLEYAAWMFLPAIASMVVSYVGLRIAFRGRIPRRFVFAAPPVQVADPAMAVASGAVLLLTLLGFFAQGFSGVPIWMVALASALILLSIHRARGWAVGTVIRGVGWDVIVFVMGMFLVAMGVRNAGLTDTLGTFIMDLAGGSVPLLKAVTGFTAAFCSSIMNNHPTAGMMIWVIEDFGLPRHETNLLVYSALIGGDLGPKMLPVGSLAAMMWFRMLRARGVEVSYLQYIRIGVPVTLAAIAVSIGVLQLEAILYDLARN